MSGESLTRRRFLRISGFTDLGSSRWGRHVNAAPFVGSRGKQAELLIRAEQEEGRVSPLLHSQFAEHLGSCVYGGLWVDEGSPISNIGGYPKSAIEFLQ